MTRARLHHPVRDESGLTLVELLVVLLVIASLLAIAVPSYLGFDRRATATTATANLRAAIPAVETYFADHGTYDAGSMTVAALRAYDRGIGPGIAVVSGSAATYCLRSTHDDATVFKNGPGGAITTTACA